MASALILSTALLVLGVQAGRTVESGESSTQNSQGHQNLTSFISVSDYPAEALRKGEQGTVGFRLVVGADGKVSDCAVISSSGSETLDRATCRLMREKARFRPATDASGNPKTDTFESQVRWRLYG